MTRKCSNRGVRVKHALGVAGGDDCGDEDEARPVLD